jgi:hypothetical protein
MKHSLLLVFSLIGLVDSAYSQAAAPSGEAPKVKVDMKRVVPSEQGTPDFAAGNVNMKRWRPKKWFELDAEFEIKVPQDAGGRNGSYSGLQANVYLVFNAQTKDGKYEAAKATLTLTSVPASESCHLLAYVSPSDLRAILQRDTFTSTTDIRGWGIEFVADGQRLAGDGNPKPTTGNVWWEKTDNLSIREGVIKAKSETPFAILFGDYDIEAKTR